MNRSFFMVAFKIDHQTDKGDKLPAFSLSIENSRSTAVYSSTEIQNELVQILQSDHHIVVYDYQDGLYERLTVRDNIAFFHRSEEHTSELQSRGHLVCRLLLEKK